MLIISGCDARLELFPAAAPRHERLSAIPYVYVYAVPGELTGLPFSWDLLFSMTGPFARHSSSDAASCAQVNGFYVFVSPYGARRKK